MKALLTIAILAAMPVMAADGGAMTDSERAYLLQQLQDSKQAMLDSISGLTPAQWKFKPAPDRWSVQECAEHIALSEPVLFGMSQGLLKSPAVARPESSNADVDQKIVMGVQDRSNKRKAPEMLVPTGRFATPDDAAKAFSEARDKSIAYVKTTNDDLRTHVGQGPAGPMDAYQFLLLMAAHSARHTAQIKEVEASPDYPKATAQLAR